VYSVFVIMCSAVMIFKFEFMIVFFLLIYSTSELQFA